MIHPIQHEMQTMWLQPTEIADVWSVNNRKENAGHIESLKMSMHINGYLPEHPIIAFASKHLGIATDKEYVVACGHPRRKAAIAAGIPLVFVEVHYGTEEDWIELMSTDNFQFDVVKNSNIGLAFTESERRAACQQLLLLPKYMKKTNTALAGEWNVSEGTIRRWRNDVESLINERSPKLDEWNVSKDRRQRLKDVIADPYRENNQGETVPVRQKAQEATAEERDKLWNEIRSTCLFKQRSDGKPYLSRHGFYMESLTAFICEKFNIEAKGIPHQLSRNNLKTIMKWVVTEDPTVIERCQWIQKDKDAASNARQDLYEAFKALETAFTLKLSPTPSNPLSKMHSQCFKQFQKNVKIQYDYKLDDRHQASTFEEILKVVSIVKSVTSDIEYDSQWVRYFKKEHTQKMRDERKRAEKTWAETRQNMIVAVSVYPRKITVDTFTSHFDLRYNRRVGTTLNKKKPSPEVDIEVLYREINEFNNARKDILADAEWVQEIPEQKSIMEVLGLTNRVTSLTITAVNNTGSPVYVNLTEDHIDAYLSTELKNELFKIAEQHGTHTDEF